MRRLDPARRSWSARLLAGAVLALGTATAPAPSAAAIPSDPPLAWSACPPEYENPAELTLECSSLLAPLDDSRPDGALVRIALGRVRATGDPGERIGSLLFNPGGPGGPGVADIAVIASLLSEEVRDAFDIVGFDPRTVGASRPTARCPDATRPDFEESTDPAAWLPYVDAYLAATARTQTSCAVANAATAGHLGTVDVARDLDRIRAALGDPRLTYLGISYGTRIGSVYAQLFPDNVRAMVLDGNMDPFGDNPSFFERGAAYERAFAQLRAWSPTAGTQFDEIMAVLANGPVDGLSSRELRNAIAQRLGAESYWPSIVATIASVHDTVVMGSTTPLPELGDAAPDEPMGVVSDGDDLPQPPELTFWAVMCQDNAARPSPQDYAATAAAQISVAPHFGFQSATEVPTCGGSPIAVRPIPRGPMATPPLLIVQSQNDPQTPFEWADAMLSTAPPGSVKLVYEGATHGASLNTSPACIDPRRDAYLLTGALPPPGTRCPFVDPST